MSSHPSHEQRQGQNKGPAQGHSQTLGSPEPDYAAANRAFYDANATGYDSRLGPNQMAEGNAAAILRRISFQADKTRMMDFACGTGLMTTLLAPHCSSVVAVDASSRMLERFSAKLSEADSKIKEKITLLRADLIPDSSSAAGERGEGVEQLEGQKLDVIVCSNSYHHFASPELVTRILASYLAPGGYLAITDLVKTPTSHLFHGSGDKSHHPHQNHHGPDRDEPHPKDEHPQPQPEARSQSPPPPQPQPHKHKHIIAHPGGFRPDAIQHMFTDAHLENFEWGRSCLIEKEGAEYELFLATATRPVA